MDIYLKFYNDFLNLFIYFCPLTPNFDSIPILKPLYLISKDKWMVLYLYSMVQEVWIGLTIEYLYNTLQVQ